MLGWSNMYPSIKLNLGIFILSTMVIMIIGHIVFTRKNDLNQRRKLIGSKYDKKIIIGILIGFALDFAYQGIIPLISIMRGSKFNYKQFTGIPTIHMILITFTPFICTYFMEVYMNTKNKKYIVGIMILFIPLILLFSRGLLIGTLLNCLFVFLFHLKLRKINIKLIIGLIVGVLAIFFVFGFLGNIRTENQVYGNTNKNGFNSELIMEIGDATNGFRESSIPKEYFWGYLYISSPIANLQNAINIDPTPQKVSIKTYFEKNVLFDFIAKRINPDYNQNNIREYLINQSLTASTFFMTSFLDWGWFGMIIIYLLLILIIIFNIVIYSKKSEKRIIGLAMLNTMIIFCSFGNMIPYSAISFQLIYPILWELSKRIKFKKS